MMKMMKMMKMTSKPHQYRSDIDGLRGIAVISVVLFHLDFSKFSGGFVGVDVFFVISGFLITQIVRNEVLNNKFSFKEFYIKRLWRLLPVLFVTVFLSFIAAFFLFPPFLFTNFSTSVLTSLFSISNFFFWLENGYFDSNSNLKPLLHTWSLSLEGQFYIIWPASLILLLNLKLKKLAPILICTTGAFSLFLAEHFINSSSSFYLLPFRVVEFCIGAIIVWLIHHRVKYKLVDEISVLIGILFILYTVLKYDESTLFPGFASLLPCVGAALVIYGNSSSKCISFFLRNRLIVWIGLISYSFYLVHWPLIVFYKYFKLEDLLNIEKYSLLFISVLLAILMYTFVEKPCRKKRINQCGNNHFLVVIISFSLLLLAASLHVWQSNGWKWRLSKEVLVYINDQFDYKNSYRSGICFINSAQEKNEIKEHCYKATKTKKKTILLLGDSHAAHLWSGFKKTFPEYKILQYTGSGCLPLLDWEHPDNRNCSGLFDMFYNYIIKENYFDLVVLASTRPIVTDPLWIKTKEKFLNNNQPYIIFGKTLKYSADLPDIIYKTAHKYRNLKGSDLQNMIKIEPYIQYGPKEEKLITTEPFFSVINTFCSKKEECLWERNKNLLVWDTTHLTEEGSMIVAEEFKAYLIKNNILP